jgi:alpha-ketoglutarate-dependent taurine dioxygenase
MLNYHIHKNGWTVILDDVDFKTISQEDVNQMAQLLATNTVVVVRGQYLSIDDEVRVAKMFKNARQFYPETVKDDEGYIHCIVPYSDNMIIRVTGAKDESGNEGFAGFDDELVWHCNDPVREERHPLVWLHSVKGSKGSRTTWNNNIFSYADLNQETKEKLKDIKLVIKHLYNDNKLEKDRYYPSLVHTNLAGKTGLFFPFLQIHKFLDLSEEESRIIMEPLIDHTTREEYLYHHDWEDGDIVISEQWLGIHKRWPFPGMKDRLLHRIVFDFPDQDY